MTEEQKEEDNWRSQRKKYKEEREVNEREEYGRQRVRKEGKIEGKEEGENEKERDERRRVMRRNMG